MPAESQRLSPLYLPCFPVCSLGSLFISLLAAPRSVKLSLAKSHQCQQRYQGTDWGFSQSPVAASC